MSARAIVSFVLVWIPILVFFRYLWLHSRAKKGTGLYERLGTQNHGLAGQFTSVGTDSGRYEGALYTFLKEWPASIIVQTINGDHISTDRILRAFDELNQGKLYTCDTSTQLKKIMHPRWKLYMKPSSEALPEIYASTGPWDIFLHDGDHEVEAQTFEYEFAWRCLRPGGYLLSDDYSWGQPEHGAFAKFMARHKLMLGKLGACCAKIQKPETDPTPPADAGRAVWVEQTAKECRALAKQALEEYKK